MEVPILYALTHPERAADDGTVPFDPVAAGQLTFEPVRHEAFPAFGLGVAAGRAGGTAPAIFNAANEVAVAAFLEGRIRFGRIPAVIEQALARATAGRADSLDAIRGADAEARRHAGEAC
jgi:1-deoxy-D-xylulose-5-phosphate reductoisomerase